MQDKGLMKAAKDYYQTPSVLPVAGSQQAIQLLPLYHRQCFDQPSRVWVPYQGYKEHEKSWRAAGYDIVYYKNFPDKTQFRKQDVVVIINPNNPTGNLCSKSQLIELAKFLKQLQGWLIVDEAFADVVSFGHSLTCETAIDNLFVLRSIGKFFGLAGIRLGFLCASHLHVRQLHNLLGPWVVNGPAQFIATTALLDTTWQMEQRRKLHTQANSLSKLLRDYLSIVPVGTDLFKTVYLKKAPYVYEQLCALGIYVRLTDERDALRFGIPTQEALTRVRTALSQIRY